MPIHTSVGAEKRIDLVEGDSVFLDLGTDFELIEASVLAFFGPAVLVVPARQLAGPEHEQLKTGAEVLFLVEEGDHLRAVSSTAKPAGRALAVTVTDSKRLTQRRWWSRAPIALEARLTPLGGGPAPTETRTADISAGGIQVARPAGMPVWPRYEVVLSGPELEAPLRAEAVPARAMPGALSLRFTEIEPDVRRKLTELVVERLGARTAVA